MTEDEAYQKALHGLVGKNAENISVATPEQRAAMPPPVIIPNGVKDRYGKLKGLDMPDVSGLYSSMPPTQTSPRISGGNNVTIGSQTFNIKANDTEGIKRELANKNIIGETFTQNFNSGMQ